MTMLFDQYADAIASYPGDFANADPFPQTLRMACSGRYEVYYAPFDHLNRHARIVLVGITPGRVQAAEALATARHQLQAGACRDAALERAKLAASFAGPLRRNLVGLLDHVGIAARLRIESTASLWGADAHLVHFTSALRYPVFERGANFSGSGIERSQFLASEVDRWFAAECRQLPGALFVPLGSAAKWACHRMVLGGALRGAQVLEGLPHPSPQNAERVAYFVGRKPRNLLSRKTNPDVLDDARERARRIVEAWAA